MKTLLIAAGVLSVVGASAGAGYYFMGSTASANVDEPKEEAYVDPVVDPRYIDIDPLVLPVIEDGRIRHHMFIKLSLEVDGKDEANTVLAKKIRLHHAFYMALYNGPIMSANGDGLDTDKIKSIVHDETTNVMGKDVIEAVTIQQAVPGQK